MGPVASMALGTKHNFSIEINTTFDTCNSIMLKVSIYELYLSTMIASTSRYCIPVRLVPCKYLLVSDTKCAVVNNSVSISALRDTVVSGVVARAG